MLSQANSLQRTILAIVTIASLMGLASHSALATPITVDYTFDLTAEKGSSAPIDHAGMVTGSFTGDPGDHCSTVLADCFLTVGELGKPNEVTSFKAIWTPDTGNFPEIFSIILNSPADNIPSKAKLNYEISTKTIINFDIAEASLDPTFRIFCTAPSHCSTDDQMTIHGLGTIGEHLEFPYFILSQSATPESSAVPEPSTAILFSIGLVGMILYAFSRRVRPVAPRRVPVADATR